MSDPQVSDRITVSEFARRAGCDAKQVRRAIEKGAITKGSDDFLAAADIDGAWRKPNRRTILKGSDNSVGEGRTTEVVRGGSDKSRGKPVVRRGESAEAAAARFVSSHGLLPIDEALALKENYLARHQQLSYDVKVGSVVLIKDVATAVGNELAGVRKKMLAIPAERAPAIHRCKTVVEVEDLLRSVIVEALEGLTFNGILPG